MEQTVSAQILAPVVEEASALENEVPSVASQSLNETC